MSLDAMLAEVKAPKPVLSVPETAEMLGLSANTVRTYARLGQIPHRRVGKRLIFSRKALLEWLEGPKAIAL